LGYQITSGFLVSTNRLTGQLRRVAGEIVGTYVIEQGTLSANNNYSLTFIPANLTITRRELMVRADNKNKLYGTINPALTFSYRGFYGGLITANYDPSVLTGSPTLSTPADVNSPVGSYPIEIGPGTLNLIDTTNYSLTLANGTLGVGWTFIDSIASQTPTNVLVSWSVVSNSTCRVQYRTDLGSGDWVEIPLDIPATNNAASFLDTRGTDQMRFYRIVIKQP
jgi:hypothetical protein